MSDTLRTRIAAVIAAHADPDGCSVCSLEDAQGHYRCRGDSRITGCNEPLDSIAAYRLHLADAVIRELGLEPQVHYDPDCEFYRYVTDWIDPQTNQRVDLP